MDILNKINYLLEKNNLKQKDLTDYLGIEKSVFSSWKNGKSKSYSKYIAEIAQFFNVSIDYLLDNEKSPSGEFEELQDEDLIILNRNAKNLTPEQRKQLLDIAKVMFKEDWND